MGLCKRVIRSLILASKKSPSFAPSYVFRSSHLVPASPSTVCIGTSIAPAAAAHMLVVYVFVSEEVIVDATLAICSIAAR